VTRALREQALPAQTLQEPTPRDRALRATLHRRLLDSPFDPALLERPELRARLARMLREEAPLLAAATADVVLDELVDDVGGLGPLEPLLGDPSITEIMVNGPDRVFVEREGQVVPVLCEIDAPTIVRVVERVIAPLGLRLDRASPMVDARLADGSRLHAVLPPLAPDGPCVSIRRFGARPVPLVAFGLEPAAGALFDVMVRAGWNLLVSGATSSGKTTCCNALARSIDPAERIVTIEETAELRLDQPHVVRLEARPANAEGTGAVRVRDLVRSALRMRPDRIIVGEVRGGEALDMLQACNTGHDGSLSTVHANSPDDALARIETLALCGDVPLPLPAIRRQLVSAIDAVVQVRRGRDGRRVIVAVAELGEGRGARTHRLLTRVDGRLVACATPSRPARRPEVDIATEWASVWAESAKESRS
jgi:pilus assembly protein CpaF